MHVLVALEGTADAPAGQFVELFAAPLGARVTVLSLAPSARARPRADRGADGLATRLRDEGVPTAVERVDGPAVPAILGRLADGDVDMVVVGAGHRDVGSRLRGSTPLRVLRQSPVPTVMVGTAPPALRHVLVCMSVDLPHGRAALRPAVAIAAATGAEVDVLHVRSQVASTVDPTPGRQTTPGPDPDAHDAARAAQAAAERRGLHDVAAEFAARDVPARVQVRRGLVVEEIAAAARQLQADLVVLGAHARPGIAAHLLANVTEQVAGELDRPVLVIREARDADD